MAADAAVSSGPRAAAWALCAGLALLSPAARAEERAAEAEPPNSQAGAAAAGPRREGTLSIGYGRYNIASGVRGDDDSQSYDIDEVMGYYGYEHRPARGWWWAADGTLGIGEATPLSGASGTVSADAYRGTLWTGALAARVGWIAPRFGLSLGPSLTGHPAWGGLVVLPSFEAWAGPSEKLYFTVKALSGPQSGSRSMSAVAGVGHRSRWARAAVLAGLQTAGASLDLHLGQGMWLGVQYQSMTALAEQADPDRRTLIRLTVAYDELGRPPSPRAAPP